MRIAGNSQANRRLSWKQLLIPGVILLVVAWMLLRSVNLGGEEFYFCDMERTVSGGNYFKSQGKKFSNGLTRSGETSFGGNYSAKLTAENPYGPGIEFTNVNGGDVIEASVWRNSTDGYGVLAFQGDWGFYTQATLPVNMTDGWELVKRKITIPLGVHNRTLKIFPYIPSRQGIVYFDNLEIRRFRAGEDEQLYPEDYAGPSLNLRVDEQSMEALREKRLEAFAYGNLVTGRRDLVDAKLDTGAMEIPVQARLKGDLLDHLQGRKWSFRILTEDGFNWRGLNEFSVHNSLSRNHLDEWVFHQLLQDEGILTTAYDFLEMSLNGDQLGIYAFEEHFTDEFLFRQERVPGVILRINEDGHWQYAPKQWQNTPPWYESAQYEAFEEKEVLEDLERSEQFAAARDLLYGFLHGNLTPAQTFDTEKLATFLAVVDLTNAYHAINYTNIRFYFNPNTSRLEPIAYDGYTDDGSRYYTAPVITGSQINERISRDFSASRGDAYLHYKLFNDLDFLRHYVGELQRVCSDTYRDEIVSNYQGAVLGRETFIKKEYQEYDFQWDYFLRNGREVREVIYPLEEISLKAYQANGRLTLEGYHLLPMEVVGFGKDEVDRSLPEPLFVEAFNREVPVRRYEIPLPGSYKNVFVRTVGTDSLVAFPIFEWSAPEERILFQDGGVEAIAQLPFLSVNADSQVVVLTGQHVIEQDIVIPNGFTLRIWPGTVLDLQQNASLICRGNVLFEGNQEAPIQIISSTGDGGGIQIGKGRSIIRHATFTGLGRAGLTESSISCYDSEITLEDCRIDNSRARNALGMQQCDYQIRNCQVTNAASDGFDLDFSTGNITGLVISGCGKDALEITGGVSELYDITSEEAGGAGLNANRKAQVRIGTLRVRNGNQGVSCTGESLVVIETLQLTNIKQGVLVFQRESVYNGAQLEINVWENEEVEQFEIVELGSKLRLGERWIEEN